MGSQCALSYPLVSQLIGTCDLGHLERAKRPIRSATDLTCDVVRKKAHLALGYL